MRRLPLLPFAERDAGGVGDSEGAYQTLRIGRRQFRRGDRIERTQRAAEFLAAEPCVQGAHLGNDGGWHRWNLGDAVEQCRKIEARTAGQDGHALLVTRARDFDQRQIAPTTCRAAFSGIDLAIKPVRRQCQLRIGRPRGQHAQVAIDLHAIGIDDRADEFARQRHRKVRLTARRRTGNDDYRLVVRCHAGLLAWRTTPCLCQCRQAIRARMAANVLTLIAADATADAQPWADEAARALDRLGAQLGSADWLAPRRAVDIPFYGLDPDQAEAAVRTSLGLGFGGPPVDALAQPAAD